MTVEFCPSEIEYWPGRYGRIVGGEASFHIRYCEGELWLVLDWRTDGCTAQCLAEDSLGVRDLIKAVLNGKEFLGGGGGGLFIINEYSQVIVPSSSGNGERVIVGEIDGRLLFDNPFEDGDDIDISDFSGLECGDLWNLPYVGVSYNLSTKSEIYYYKSHEEGGNSEFPPVQDNELITNLRNVRNAGAVKFIVNPYGIVLTKRPVGPWNNQIWEPVFVGYINFEQWFTKEEI
jgi:hypothetical protein